jgi:hypothetical protein
MLTDNSAAGTPVKVCQLQKEKRCSILQNLLLGSLAVQAAGSKTKQLIYLRNVYCRWHTG